MDLACVCEKTGFVFLTAVEGAISKICSAPDQKGRPSTCKPGFQFQIFTSQIYSIEEECIRVCAHSPRLLNYYSRVSFPPAGLWRSCSFTRRLSEQRDHRLFYCCSGIGLDCCCSPICRPESCWRKTGDGRLANPTCFGKKPSVLNFWHFLSILPSFAPDLLPASFRLFVTHKLNRGDSRGMLTKLQVFHTVLSFSQLYGTYSFSDVAVYPQLANMPCSAVHFGAGKHMIMISPSQLSDFGKVGCLSRINLQER